jgi:hypothetical protein
MGQTQGKSGKKTGTLSKKKASERNYVESSGMIEKKIELIQFERLQVCQLKYLSQTIDNIYNFYILLVCYALLSSVYGNLEYFGNIFSCVVEIIR